MKFFYKLFSNNYISLLILFSISIIFFFSANYLYNYEESLSRQDAREYILLANNPLEYFNIGQQEAMRILPSLIVFSINKIFDFEIYLIFKYLVYLSFLLFVLKLFTFLKKFNLKNELCVTIIGILVFTNHSILYTVFNVYQLLDILLYLLLILIIEASLFNKNLQLFFSSLLAIFVKEFLIVLIITGYIYNYLQFKNKKNIFISLLLLFVFFSHFHYAGINSDPNDSASLINNSKYFVKSFSHNFFIAMDCLIYEKKILLFFPFLLILFSKNFYKNEKLKLIFFIYSFIPISFSIFFYDIVGNNFFRVYYQGYFLILMFSLIYFSKIIENSSISKNLFFLSPLLFLIDYIYILLNISQHGFYNFLSFDRYTTFSGYYFFNIIVIIIIFLNFKKIYLSKL